MGTYFFLLTLSTRCLTHYRHVSKWTIEGGQSNRSWVKGEKDEISYVICIMMSWHISAELWKKAQTCYFLYD